MKNNYKKILAKLMFLLSGFLVLTVSSALVRAQSSGEKLEIMLGFNEGEIAPNQKIELRLSRALTAEEGTLAVFVNETDLTALLQAGTNTLNFAPQFFRFPAGENKLTVYLVGRDGQWTVLQEFALRVAANKALEGDAPAGTTGEKTNVEFTPNVTLNLKGQNQTLTFPREAAPERDPFTDLAGQGTFSLKVSRRGWTLSNQFDFAGSSFQPEALRFGELGVRAPQIDLSSYLVELAKGRFKFNLGHVSFGSNRHLINSFSSRGVTVTIPISKQNEISLAAANGTSVVGFGNFVGITRRKHSILSAAFARDFFKERPGGLKVEFSVMRGSLLPLSNFNQREVNDAERSLGFGVRVLGSNKTQRLRYEFGFTRSRFTNPGDPLLEQGFDVKPVRATSRNARYGEISFDFLPGLKLWDDRTLKVTGTFRHEEIAPLFRSIGVSTQADKRQNQFEVSASLGGINFVYGNLGDRDNLNNLPSILKTLLRRQNMTVSMPLNSFFTPSKPVKWLPQISYSYDHVHNFGVALPLAGEFTSLSQVPDQDNFSHAFNAQWQFSDGFSFGYRFNRAFQDNKQPGRERADFASSVSGFTFSLIPWKALSWNFDVSAERQESFEQPRVDRTFRLGSGFTWQMPLIKNATLSANLSTTVAGDTNNFNDSRNAEFDIQWAYKFGFGKEKYKKTEAQFFIRYANRYGDSKDRLLFINNFNKAQNFNFGLNFNIF
jgi:hypothetical protein